MIIKNERINEHMKKRFLALTTVAIMTAIMLTGCMDLIDQFTATEDMVDYDEVIELGANEYAVYLNNELQTFKGTDLATDTVYLGMDGLSSVNGRFYWDSNEKLLIYTTPTDVIKASPDAMEYTVNGQAQAVDYVIVKEYGDQAFVALPFIQQYTQMDYQVFSEPSRMTIHTEWGDCQVVTANEDTVVRHRGGIKSGVLTHVTKGTQMTYLDVIEDWTHVATADGYTGYVQTKYISEPEASTTTAPAFEEPVYTSIQKDYKINMAWHQMTNMAGNDTLEELTANTTGINTISPTWFSFADTEGNLNSLASADYVNLAHSKGMEVWALFSNEFPGDDGLQYFDGTKIDEVLSYTSKREAVIASLMGYVEQYGIDGINIDFERISEEGADNYIQFIRELGIQCRAKGIVLSVDSYVPVYSKHYNRKEQAIVADYVVIMGYDEHFAGSEEAGSVASKDFVAQGIADTLAEVPAEKMINAIPLYTRLWWTESDGSLGTMALSMAEGWQYVQDNGAEATWLEDVGQYYAKYEADGKTYQIWLEDSQSVGVRMQMIKDNNLAGVASWKLGRESGIEIWETIQSYLQ